MAKKDDDLLKGVHQDENVKVRDYINSYGSQYGITNDMIGWQQSTDPHGGGNVLLGGQSIMNVRPDQIQNNSSYGSKSQLQAAIDNYAKENKLTNIKSGYENPYSAKVDGLLEQILNQPKFNYNVNSDPSFQSYQAQYAREGQRAAADTMATASSMTGGRLNSWAQSVGSQAQQQWSNKLMDRVPELEQAAYNRYLNERNINVQNLQQLMALDNQGYDRFADNRNFNRNTFESDRGFNRGVLESDRAHNTQLDRYNVADNQWQQSFDYTKDIDKRNYDYQVSRDKILDGQWLKQFNASEQQRIIQNALQSRQISVSEANQALSQSRFNYDKQRDQVMDKRYEDEIKRAAEKTGANPNTLGAAYNAMLSAKDPAEWLRNEAPYMTDAELKAMAGFLPKDSNTEELLRLLLK